VRVWRTADGTFVGESLTGHDGPVRAGGGRGAAGRRRGNYQRRRGWHGAGVPDRRRHQVVPPLNLPESVQAVAVHGNVIITATGADITVHQPALSWPMRQLLPCFPEQRPVSETT
jgi:hypothetical protein